MKIKNNIFEKKNYSFFINNGPVRFAFFQWVIAVYKRFLAGLGSSGLGLFSEKKISHWVAGLGPSGLGCVQCIFFSHWAAGLGPSGLGCVKCIFFFPLGSLETAGFGPAIKRLGWLGGFFLFFFVVVWR